MTATPLPVTGQAGAVLVAESLACRRGEREVFRSVSFSIGAGEALLLRGPNGAGKSSLLRLLAGLARPAGGHLLWQGQNLEEDLEGHRRRLSYLAHADALKPQLTVWENVAFWAQLRGADPAATVPAALATFDVAHLAELPAGILSAGQRKRVALARLLAAPAPLWLLDEPTVALDEDGVATLETAAGKHLDSGGVLLCATHLSLDLPRRQELHLGRAALP